MLLVFVAVLDEFVLVVDELEDELLVGVVVEEEVDVGVLVLLVSVVEVEVAVVLLVDVLEL